MPALTGVIQAEGALVDVLLGWSAAQAAQARAALRPVPPPITARAVLDTGAEVSCVDAALVKALALPLGAVVLANVPAAGGLIPGAQYAVGLTVAHPSGDLKDNLALRNLLVVELPLGALGYEVLVGRDVLASCDFLYSGRQGHFTLSY